MIATWELLRSLGFTEDSGVMSDPPGGLSFDFGNLKLAASLTLSNHFQPVMLLTGVMGSPSEISRVEYQMPREVQSLELGIALVTYCLDQAAGREFEPAFKVPWLVLGRQYKHLLPWEQDDGSGPT